MTPDTTYGGYWSQGDSPALLIPSPPYNVRERPCPGPALLSVLSVSAVSSLAGYPGCGRSLRPLRLCGERFSPRPFRTPHLFLCRCRCLPSLSHSLRPPCPGVSSRRSLWRSRKPQRSQVRLCGVCFFFCVSCVPSVPLIRFFGRWGCLPGLCRSLRALRLCGECFFSR